MQARWSAKVLVARNAGVRSTRTPSGRSRSQREGQLGFVGRVGDGRGPRAVGRQAVVGDRAIDGVEPAARGGSWLPQAAMAVMPTTTGSHARMLRSDTPSAVLANRAGWGCRSGAENAGSGPQDTAPDRQTLQCSQRSVRRSSASPARSNRHARDLVSR